ncbi:MAG TPA: D-alanine--D-alanine ligase [Candidatus Bipolaricaulota bacterium]|nr:D-alanine--D-alanine ligase [Candidatus Bipolaricaulota bacterium]
MLKIAVIGGGSSSERKVSLNSSKKVFENLDETKYEKYYFDFPNDLEKFLENHKNLDVVMPVLHGVGGEDGQIQGFLKTLGLKFTFSDVTAQAIAMDKHLTEILIKTETDIKMPESKTFEIDEINTEEIEKSFSYPLVIKPTMGGSSLGAFIVKDRNELEKGLIDIKTFNQPILVQDYITGRELTVAILGNKRMKALPVIEICPKKEFFDYQAKYDSQFCEEICPAEIDDALAQDLQRQALLAHQVIGCRGLSRSDFIVTKDNEIFFLETNTIPGMTSESLAPKAAAADGYSYPEFLDKLIELAQEA